MRQALIIAVLAVTMAGCSSAGGVAATHHPPDVLRWGVVGLSDVPTLDPALASDATSISVASLIYGGLVRLDWKLRVRPDGAARWTISRDGRVYTFYLRHNLRFADGRPVRATDFVAALQRALGPEASAGPAAFYLGLIQRARSPTNRFGVTAVSSTTVRITLARPAAHFLSELAFPVSFVPDPGLESRFGSSWTDHAAGFGPYSVRIWRHGRSLTLARNPYYYGGRPPLRQITLHLYTGARSAMDAYRRGDLDLVSGFQAGTASSLDPAGLRRVPALALDYLAFNTAHLPFYRLNARRALAAAWRPGLASQTMGETAFPATSFLPSPFAVPVAQWKPASSPATYLVRARYPPARRFPPVTLVMPADGHLAALATTLAQRWRRSLGIKVTVQALNPSQYSAALDARDFDLALVRWGADYPDPQDFLGTQLGKSSDNVTGWTRRAYDRAIALAESYAPGDPRRIQLFEGAGRLAARKVPILPLDQPAQTAVIRPGLRDVALTPLGTIVGNWPHAGFTH